MQEARLLAKLSFKVGYLGVDAVGRDFEGHPTRPEGYPSPNSP